MPGRLWFKPRGVPLSGIPEVILNADELEAMRLKHKLSLNQKKAAERMNISRTTFARTLKRAHEKVTKFLTEGTALRIEEPEYVYTPRKFRCEECGHEWKAPYGTGRPVECPECGSGPITPMYKEKTGGE